MQCQCPYPVVCLTETWWHSKTDAAEAFGSDYIVYRKDRNAKNSPRNPDGEPKKRGGGVAIAVSKSLKSKILRVRGSAGLEQVWIQMSLGAESGWTQPKAGKSPEMFQNGPTL
ncbi:hypothetical protein pipiens_000921, partial [Culex pipiens pipiens]|uniref:(northern house mosquito) hypothetical protein n=2 Tax=Culex pipiens TaxID=7175 RepID=A0A8D8I419_CULPI